MTQTPRFRPSTRRIAALSGALAMITAAAMADRVVLNSGREITGAIVAETPAEVTIRSEVGLLKFTRSEIRSVVRDNMTEDEVAGDRASASGNWDIATEAYRKAAAVLEQGSEARNRVEQKLARAEGGLERVRASKTEAALSQARALFTSGDLDGALRSAEQVESTTSDEMLLSATARLISDIHLARARVAADRQDPLGFDRELKAAVDADPSYYRAQLEYGELLARSSVTEAQGIEMLERGLSQGRSVVGEQDQIKFNYILGRKHFSRGEFEKAAERFANCIGAQARYPGYDDALDWAVKSYLKLGEQTGLKDVERTIANLNEALRLNPENKDALFFLGSLYKDSGQTGEAIEALKMLTTIDPTYPQANLALARAHLDAQQFEDALAALDAELRRNPSEYDALTDRAEVNILLANYDNAKRDLEAATRIDPNKWRAFLLQAQLSFAQEDFTKAQESLQRVLQIKQDSVEANILMGRVFVADKQYDTARKWFEAVIQYLQALRTPSYRSRRLMAEAQTYLGEVDLVQDSPRSAEERFREALEFMPDFARAISKVGDVKRRLGDEMADRDAKAALYAEARQNYEKAIEMNPRDPDFYLALGILYHKNLKNPDGALKNYREYLERGGRDKVSVNKWIEEVEGGALAVEETFTTATDAGTTETTSTLSDGATTATDSGTTPTVAASPTAPADAAAPPAADAATTPSEAATPPPS